MMRRWIFHYEVSSAIVRLVTFIVITWSISAFVNSKNGPDQPVRTWMINCFILLITDIIRLSIVSDPKYHGKSIKQDPRIFLRFTVMKVLIFPMTVATCLSVFAVLLQMDRLYYTASQLMMGHPVLLNHQLSPSELTASATTVLILIVSSWSSESFERRQMLRKTCLRLTQPNQGISVTYRFVIGQPPSARTQMMTGPSIIRESESYRDMIMVPSSDLHMDKSRKVYESFVWANQYSYDYIIKSDDNIFVRWDTILHEVAMATNIDYYWRGLTFHHIPIQLQPNDNLEIDYALPVLPSYTHGMLYILSKSTVDLILHPIATPRRFLQRSSLDGENIALWLFGFDIKPIHDRRIQDAHDVCQSDLIAKKIHRLNDMSKMYLNVVNGRDQCTGIERMGCAVCYPCHDKKISWRTLNLDCNMNGITVRPMSGFNQITGKEP
jgi:hypothetical protein